MNSDLEQRVLDKWPVLKFVKEFLNDKNNPHYNPRGWIYMYASISAKYGMPLHEKMKDENRS